MVLRSNNDFSLILLIIVVTIAIVFILGLFLHYENRYNILRDNYEFLESKYENLNSSQDADYNSLLDQYNELQENYNNIYNKYVNNIKEYNSNGILLQKFNAMSIDHLMALTLQEIRREYQPNYFAWEDDPIYYEEISVEYAADVCAHDIGRIYWPDIENQYFMITGHELCDKTYDIIFQAIELANLTGSDTNSEIVEKILSFTSSNIQYQDDLNDEFLFPSETLTYKTGDCDDFSILTAALFEYKDIESAIGFFDSAYYDYAHCMVLVQLNDVIGFDYYYYDDLTEYGLSPGRWIMIEPQSSISDQSDRSWFEKWEIYAAAEIPN